MLEPSGAAHCGACTCSCRRHLLSLLIICSSAAAHLSVRPIFEDSDLTRAARFHLFIWGKYRDAGKVHLHFDVRVQDRNPSTFGVVSQLRLQEAISVTLDLQRTDVVFMGRTVEYDDSLVIEFELFVGSEKQAQGIVKRVQSHSFAHSIKQWKGWQVLDNVKKVRLSFSIPVVDGAPRHYYLGGLFIGVMVLTICSGLVYPIGTLYRELRRKDKRLTFFNIFQLDLQINRDFEAEMSPKSRARKMLEEDPTYLGDEDPLAGSSSADEEA